MPDEGRPATDRDRPECDSPADRPSARISTHLLLLSSVVIWGSTFVATKHALGFVTPVELVGLRFAIGLPILATVVAAKRMPFGFERRDGVPLLLGSSILLLHFLLQPIALSMERTTATNTGWIISFSPLWIAVLSRVFLRERLGARQITGIAAATLGVLLLVSGGSLEGLGWLESAGDWLIFLTSLTWAAYTVVTRDLARRRGALVVTLVMFVPLCLICLAAMAWRGNAMRLLELPLSVVFALLFLGVLGTLAQWFWQIGVADLGAARAGLYVYLEPLATTALAVPLLHERFGAGAAAGGLLVLAGVYWAQRTGTRAARQREATAPDG